MIVLHGRGGFYLLDSALDKESLDKLLFNTARVLRARGLNSAASLLNRIPFIVFTGSNDFGDDFHVLFATLSLEVYEQMRELSEDEEGRHVFYHIAEVMSEIGPYIRFIGCELEKDLPDQKWYRLSQSRSAEKNQSERKTVDKKLPVVVCAVVNEVLPGSHAILDALFKNAGAPGDPPPLSHATKWKMWLMRASEDPNTDAHQVLGKVLEEFMEAPPPDDSAGVSNWQEQKKRVEDVLEKYGLRYLRGGRIVETGGGIASEAMAEALKDHDFEMVEVEFRRALQYISDDPGAAITAGCALLEALFKAYLEANEVALPSKQTIKPLWSVVQKELGLHPKDQADADIQRILSGMTSVVDGVGALRTHAGSAHGGGKLRYKVKPRHARLLINSAHTLALFLIETWKERAI